MIDQKTISTLPEPREYNVFENNILRDPVGLSVGELKYLPAQGRARELRLRALVYRQLLKHADRVILREIPEPRYSATPISQVIREVLELTIENPQPDTREIMDIIWDILEVESGPGATFSVSQIEGELQVTFEALSIFSLRDRMNTILQGVHLARAFSEFHDGFEVTGKNREALEALASPVYSAAMQTLLWVSQSFTLIELPALYDIAKEDGCTAIQIDTALLAIRSTFNRAPGVPIQHVYGEEHENPVGVYFSTRSCVFLQRILDIGRARA